jgi:hypothetical protein
LKTWCNLSLHMVDNCPQALTQWFLFSILWWSWSGDHPWDDLARFGYILDIKVEKSQIPCIFLATYWNLS